MRYKQKELEKLHEFYLSYFLSKSHFKDDKTQNYLVFNQFLNILKHIQIVIELYHRNLKICQKKSIKPLATSDDSIAPGKYFSGNKIRVKFDGNCLKEEKNNI